MNITMLQLDEFTVVEEKKSKPKGISSKGSASRSTSKERTNMSYGDLVNLLSNMQ